jgi:hypothetical protein
MQPASGKLALACIYECALKKKNGFFLLLFFVCFCFCFLYVNANENGVFVFLYANTNTMANDKYKYNRCLCFCFVSVSRTWAGGTWNVECACTVSALLEWSMISTSQLAVSGIVHCGLCLLQVAKLQHGAADWGLVRMRKPIGPSTSPSISPKWPTPWSWPYNNNNNNAAEYDARFLLGFIISLRRPEGGSIGALGQKSEVVVPIAVAAA